MASFGWVGTLRPSASSAPPQSLCQRHRSHDRRQLLRRPGYDLDIERVLHACAEHGVAVEINGNPWRLDLDWRWHQRGCELGCLFSINPDAHSVPEIDSSTHWGVEVARKGGLGRDRVVNTLDLSAFTRWLDTRRSRAAA